MKNTLLSLDPVNHILLHHRVLYLSPCAVLQMKHLPNRLDLGKCNSMLICCDLGHPSCSNVLLEELKLFLRKPLSDNTEREFVLVP